MASRQVTTRKRQSLRDDIRNSCANGRLKPGEMVPTIRELQARYELSSRIVHEELSKLVDEGLLISRPRVGTFVADRDVSHPDTYLMITPPHPELIMSVRSLEKIRAGFEDKITELGGASVVLTLGQDELASLGPLPAVAGVFGAGAKDIGELRGVVPDEVPRVRWQTMAADLENWRNVDTIAPDHRGAGRRAAEHLMGRGHQRVGFLGVHTNPQDRRQVNHWSALVETGWAEAVSATGEDADNLAFRVTRATDHRREQAALATVAARPLVARRDITAVVCSSTSATEGLAEALRDAGVPTDAWPAMVTIGNTESDIAAFTTSIRMPHHQMGRAAAACLWSRVHGDRTGPPHHQVIPMPIVRRADHHHDWLELAATRGTRTA